MEQRARVMGKTAEAAVYRRYIEKMKKITKSKNEADNLLGTPELTKKYKKATPGQNEETEPHSEGLEDAQVQAEDSEEQEGIRQEEIFVSKTVEQLGKQNLVNEQTAEKDLEAEFKRFKDLVTKQLSTLGGGGAVNIRDLDDVDRTTALVDGKFLKYRASDGKFIGAEASGGSGDVSAGVIELEGSTDQLVLDGTDASATDAGDQITQEIGTEDYVLGKDGYINDDGFEWVNDNNTTTTVDTENTYVTLTNTRKSQSLSQYLPEGVTRIWDDTNNKLYFNQLERKDWLIIRVGLKINPTVHNVRIVVRLLVTQKHNGSFPLEAPATVLGPSGAGISYDPEFLITFYVGDLEGYETTDTYGEIQVQGDGPFTVEDFDILTIKG